MALSLALATAAVLEHVETHYLMWIYFMCGLAFWCVGHQLNFLLHTKACFPPLNCEVQQFIFTRAWWLINGCEDSGWDMIHWLTLLTLGSPFLLHIITRASILSQREMENTLSQCGWREWGLKKLFSSCQNEICSVSASALHVQLSLCRVDVLFLVCLLPFINTHVFLWDCGV